MLVATGIVIAFALGLAFGLVIGFYHGHRRAHDELGLWGELGV